MINEVHYEGVPYDYQDEGAAALANEDADEQQANEAAFARQRAAGMHQEVSAWEIGSDLALALLEDAHDVGQAASLEAQHREAGKPQNNIVLSYLEQAARFGDPHVTEAFAAVLSEYVSSCEGGGVPDVEFLRKIAKAPPGPGTGETEDTEPEHATLRSHAAGMVLVLTAQSHAIEARREAEEDDDLGTATTALDTIAKQLSLIEDVLAGNEGPLP
jgi:hypothetical protein